MEYLFCDKTGTLTENIMQFRQCSVNGTLFKEINGQFREYETAVPGMDQVDSALVKTTMIDQIQSVRYRYVVVSCM